MDRAEGWRAPDAGVLRCRGHFKAARGAEQGWSGGGAVAGGAGRGGAPAREGAEILWVGRGGGQGRGGDERVSESDAGEEYRDGVVRDGMHKAGTEVDVLVRESRERRTVVKMPFGWRPLCTRGRRAERETGKRRGREREDGWELFNNERTWTREASRISRANRNINYQNAHHLILMSHVEHGVAPIRTRWFLFSPISNT